MTTTRGSKTLLRGRGKTVSFWGGAPLSRAGASGLLRATLRRRRRRLLLRGPLGLLLLQQLLGQDERLRKHTRLLSSSRELLNIDTDRPVHRRGLPLDGPAT